MRLEAAGDHRGAIAGGKRCVVDHDDFASGRIEAEAEQPAGQPRAFNIGVRREFLVYLLIAVIIVTALEWATFHRRVTV